MRSGTVYSVAKEAIDYAIDHSKTLKEFQFALKEMGYAYNLSPSRKYWTVIPKGYDKPIRLKNLGADYTNDRIVERIKENRNRWAEIEPFQRATYKPRQYRMQTRGQKLKKKGGLYGLYLYYCYRLGCRAKSSREVTKEQVANLYHRNFTSAGYSASSVEKYHYPSDCHRRNRGNLLLIPGVLAVLQCRSHGVPDKVAKIIRIKVLVNDLFSCQNTSEWADLFVVRN